MRSIPAPLAAELASGATTLCRCWKAIRSDGGRFGFTDHDRDLTFDSVTFRAATGLEASEAEALLGLAVGGGEVSGALSTEALTDKDIEAGLWDGATIETWLVDWRDVTRRMLLDAGQIGEIRRQGEAFTAEVRSLAQGLDQDQGRRYNALCDAELGDARCGVSLTSAANRLMTSVAGVPDATSFTFMATAGFDPGLFTGGAARFSSGINSGQIVAIMGHTRVGSLDVITLWSALRAPLAPGDPLALTVGCDKRFSTCRDRFANVPNFRGFPHIPGNDHLMGYARQGEPGQDGGAIQP
jgi:uncharacterized phage protein (TIGR02218 family)